MKTIHKYPIAITDRQDVTMPRSAGIVHVGLDPNGHPCIWAMVETGNPMEDVAILIIGTGNPIPDDAGYHFGSFVQGPFVWHVYSGD